jgi:hypothetical protein
MNYTSVNDAFDLDINSYKYKKWTINDYDNDIDIDNDNDIDNNNNNNNNNNKDNKDDNIDVDKLLNDYNNINISLKNNINSLNKLELEKKEIHNYKSNIFSKHQDVMIKLYNKDIGEMNDINDTIIKYIDLIKNYSEKWNTDIYNKNKKSLEISINKQEEQLASYRKLFINTTNEIIKTEKLNKNLCPICFENEINMCSIPCGHTCCNECLTQTIKFQNSRVTKCLNCRSPINDYIRFFIQL